MNGNYDVCCCEKVNWIKIRVVIIDNLKYEICNICNGSVSVEGAVAKKNKN